MKVLELLEEIEEIIETASGFPLTGKIMIDAEELREIVKEIRTELPDEIQQAQWITQQKNEIISEAKSEYEAVIRDARRQAEVLIDTNDITMKAKAKSEDIIANAENKSKQLKLGTYEYMDSILSDFQVRMEQLYAQYFVDMYASLENTFNGVGETLQANREEIQQMAEEVAQTVSQPRAFNMDVVTESTDEI